MSRFRVAASLLLALVSVTSLRADFPKSQGYITDTARLLDAGAVTEIDASIRETEQKTAAEIAVVTVASLDGMSVEEYANRLFKEWGIGKKGRDNGVLILVAFNDRKIRIEVGYGLEPVLPDGLAGEIIRNAAIPAFKDGDFPKGIVATVRRVTAIVQANETVSPEERKRFQDAASGGLKVALLMTFFFGMFIAIGAVMLGVGLRSKALFFVFFGAAFGGIPYALTLLTGMNVLQWILTPLAVGMVVLGWRKGAKESWRQAARSGSGKSSSGGWVMGASSSSSSGGSSSSSGDSFGGGSSGGGGASGSW
jgi:uncharacterized protein